MEELFMNQMQRMIQEAQRMQNRINKLHAELETKEFTVEKNGLVKITMLGKRELTSIHIDSDSLEEDKEVIEDTLRLAINEALLQIQKEEDAINEQVTSKAGFPF